jgi:hypothetical protein
MLVMWYEPLRKEKIMCIRYNFLLFPETIEGENWKEVYHKVTAVGENTKHVGNLIEEVCRPTFLEI